MNVIILYRKKKVCNTNILLSKICTITNFSTKFFLDILFKFVIAFWTLYIYLKQEQIFECERKKIAEIYF